MQISVEYKGKKYKLKKDEYTLDGVQLKISQEFFDKIDYQNDAIVINWDYMPKRKPNRAERRKKCK